MGLCLSTSYVDEPVRPPVQTYVLQQQQPKPQVQPYITPSAPPMNTTPPNYVPYSQYTYAVPYTQTPAPIAKQSFSNDDPQPIQYAQPTPQMYPQVQMYPPVQTYYVQQPVYRQPVQQQNNTALSIAGGFLAGSIIADMMDD